MASRGLNQGIAGSLRFLAVHRTVVYLGGVLTILSPSLFEKAGVAVSSPTRTAVVLASLSIMVATYVGERRFVHGDADAKTGAGGDTTGSETTTATAYSRRTRLTVALAIAGFAVGLYVAVEVSQIAGIAFVAGAYLFGHFAFRGGGDGN